MKWIVLISVTISLLHGCNAQYEYFKRRESTHYEIAGIFKDKSSEQTLAFNETTSKSNLNGTNIKLKPVFLHPLKTDSFAVWKELCKQKHMRPIAIFGPQNAISDGSIREQCALAQIPHLQAAWQPYDANINYEEVDESSAEITYKNITVNFYPDADEIAIAYAQLLKFYQWENFAVLYEDDYSLLRVQKILALHTTNHPVFIRRLHPEEDSREIFKELKKYQESRVLIDCHINNIMKYMETAQSLGIVDHYQHYILVSLDSGMNADSLKVFQSNITWLSLTEHEGLSNADHFLSPRVHAWTEIGDSRPVYKFHAEALIMFDVANHVVQAINKVQETLESKLLPPETGICDEDITPWEHGAALQEHILNSTSYGVTGNVQFNPSTGKRFNYTLFVNEIHVNVLRTIAQWQSTNPEHIEVVNNATVAGVLSATKEFIVVSRNDKPYLEIIPCEEDGKIIENKKCFQGFSVDLVDEIFKVLHDTLKLNYSYVFKHEKDQSYGRYNPLKKKWDGLIGDLLDKKADLAVCDLTITEERKKVVDFSVPFMTLGISILYTKIDEIPPAMFSFLNPYSLDVWLYIATAYCGVSVVLFLCARISPADWENPQPCDKDPEELENIWNFKNCAWLTMGSIMTQGCDILPKAFGSRWVCAMWWFFAVIVCQTYIAQLSASMTSAMADEAINDVEDLAKQSKVMYGAIKGGSTVDFFKNSKDKMYRTMYEKMVANDEVLLAASNDEGASRVLSGRNKYAFFMESTTIEYKKERNCKLRKVGGLLDSKDYGIGMPANSPFRTDINTAILILKEKTILTKIKEKWWSNKTEEGDSSCNEKVDLNDVEGDLEVDHLIGAFVVLIAGIGVSLFITAAEFFDEVRNIVIREQVTHKEAFIKELKASLNFTQLQKPVLRNPSRAPSIISTKSQLETKLTKRAQVIENFMDLEKNVQ